MLSDNMEHRKEPRLRRARYSVKPQRYYFFDCEANIKRHKNGFEDHSFRMCVLTDITYGKTRRKHRRYTQTFWDKLDFNKFILKRIKRNETLTLIAHNVKYDLQLSETVQYLLTAGMKMRTYYSTEGTFVCVLKAEWGEIKILDTMNWFKSTLRELGDRINLPKLDADFDNISDKDIVTYCKRDVEIMVRTMELYKQWLADNFKCNVGFSRSNDAMSIFRSQRPFIELHYNNDLGALQFELNCYYGGRTEVFEFLKNPKFTVHYLDVNSLYPSVMIDHKYSYRMERMVKDPEISELDRWSKFYNLAAWCHIETADPAYPVYHDGKLVFPIGAFDTCLCGDELIHAWKAGNIVDIYHLQVYNRADLFGPTISKLYEMRKDAKSRGNEIDSYAIKIAMNSLYGKFGQRYEQLTPTGEHVPEMFGDGMLIGDTPDEHNPYRIFNYEIYLTEKNVLTRNTFPIISAEIAANARQRMWTLMKKCGLKNIYYMDTDSLMVNDLGLKRLKSHIDPTRLGYLKHEKSSKKVVIRGAKSYTFGTDTRRKGVPKDAKKIGKNTWKYNHWRTYKEYLESSKDYIPMIKQVTRKETLEYTKRHVDKDGKTRALIFPMDI